MSLQRPYRYSHTIGLFSLIGRGFNNPVDMALGPDGVLFVLNRAGPDVAGRMPNKRVSVCTVTQDYLGEFSTGGTEDGQMLWPAAMAIGQDGHLYISDEALHRISIFDQQGQFLGKWGTRGTGDGEFDRRHGGRSDVVARRHGHRPSGLAFDKNGNLLVVDGLNNRIQRYTPEGRYLGGWGRGGHADGEFNLPWGITVEQWGDVYVADWRNDRVHKLDAEGKHLATWGTPGQGGGEFRRPAGVAVGEEGEIYVADWGNERVQVLDPDGGFITELRGDADLSKWAEDYFVPNKEECEERQKADLEPELELLPDDQLRQRSASIEKLFWGPCSIKLDGDGRIYIVDTGRYRIQIYRKEGKALVAKEALQSVTR